MENKVWNVDHFDIVQDFDGETVVVKCLRGVYDFDPHRFERKENYMIKVEKLENTNREDVERAIMISYGTISAWFYKHTKYAWFYKYTNGSVYIDCGDGSVSIPAELAQVLRDFLNGEVE